MAKVKLICQLFECGNEFQRRPSQLTRGRGKFCSKTCRIRAMSRQSAKARRVEPVPLTCKECGDTYQRKPGEVIRSKYCGMTCKMKAMQGKSVALKQQRALELFATAKHMNNYWEIPLTKGGIYLISDEDVEAVKYWNWSATKAGYIHRRAVDSDKGWISMHRLIMERKLGRTLKPDEWIDHRKGKKNDNRRSQLRLCSRRTNPHNIRKTDKKRTSIYKGVSWDGRRGGWRAVIQYQLQYIQIGRFKTEIEAAYAYDQWAMQLFGRFAVLNVL